MFIFHKNIFFSEASKIQHNTIQFIFDNSNTQNICFVNYSHGGNQRFRVCDKGG